MSDLADLTESLKRAVAVPGAFADAFPNTGEDDLALTLADGFAEAQLYGFFADTTLTDDTIVTPDIPTAGQALVVIFAATRILESELGNRKTHTRYEASGAVFEQDQGASAIVERLKALRSRREDLLDRAERANYSSEVFMADLYFIRATTDYGSALSGFDWFDALGL